jgi:multisubunit Na+/H+ antiporter MnhG subunit
MDRPSEVSTTWTGWIGFASIMLTIIGAINFFEGLIAVIRDQYYVVHGDQLVLFDTTTWGWLMMIFGVLLFLVGLGLASKQGWARWTAVILVAVNLLANLGWLGNSGYPLWTLTVVALEIVVLYALTARWSDVASY